MGFAVLYPSYDIELEFLDPWPDFELRAPSRTRLLQDMPVICGDGIGIEHRVRLVGGLCTDRTADAAIDHEMRDMDSLRREFAGERLCEAAQREFAHGEGRRLSKTLDAGGGAGEQDGAALVRQHALQRLLRDQETAEGADGNGGGDIGRREFDERAAGALAGIVDDDVGGADLRFDILEELRHVVGLRGIAGEGFGAGLAAERIELAGIARGEGDADALLRQQARERCADAFAGADDQGRFVVRDIHGRTSGGSTLFMCVAGA